MHLLPRAALGVLQQGLQLGLGAIAQRLQDFARFFFEILGARGGLGLCLLESFVKPGLKVVHFDAPMCRIALARI
ncbi:MAG: hypothetical protein E6J88_07575 [Deltaproteobacteria bacterium]|nr:MAG: hypothetical protein E6J88_07575 [Deltaproteobacteria bacterium]